MITVQMTNPVELAKTFATIAHSAVGQVRKYTGEDYINHPAEVYAILMRNSVTHPDILAAAWLHDVLEDTKVSPYLLRQMFGDRITTMVLELTDVSTPGDGNRATRKALDRAHLEQASDWSKMVKMADCISNAHSIFTRDPDFAKVYLVEIEALMETAFVGVHKALYEELRMVLDIAKRRIAV